MNLARHASDDGDGVKRGRRRGLFEAGGDEIVLGVEKARKEVMKEREGGEGGGLSSVIPREERISVARMKDDCVEAWSAWVLAQAAKPGNPDNILP